MTRTTRQSGAAKPWRSKERSLFPQDKQAEAARKKVSAEHDQTSSGISVQTFREFAQEILDEVNTALALTQAERLAVVRRSELAMWLYELSRNAAVPVKERQKLGVCVDLVCTGNVDQASALYDSLTWPREKLLTTDRDGMASCFSKAKVRPALERRELTRKEMDPLRKELARLAAAGPARHVEIKWFKDKPGYEFRQTESDGGVDERSGIYHDSRPKGPDDVGSIPGNLAAYFEAKNLPRDLWESTAAEIERVLRKQVVAEHPRPLWEERARFPELANLSAPEFLKRVWADQIDSDGRIERDLIAQRDRKLLLNVSTYISKREDRGQSLGDAEGLRLVSSKVGRPRRATFE